MITFNHIKCVGVQGVDDYSLVRKIQLTNVLAFVSAFLTFILDIGFIIGERDYRPIINIFLIGLFLALPIYFNSIKWYFFAKNWLLSVMAIGVLSGPFFNGENIPVEIIFLPCVGIPFLLFNRKEIILPVIWSAIYLALYFVAQYLYTIITPLDPLSVEEGEVMFPFLMVMVFLWAAGVFISISNENKFREELIEKNLRKEKELRINLESSYSKLIKSQDDLINKEKERIKAQESERQALKKADFKAKFLAKMSHELRTPLNGIIGNLELWDKRSKFDDLNKGYFNKVVNSSQLLLGIVNDVLDISKIEDGKMELRPEPVNLKNVIQNSIALFETIALEKDVKIELDYDESIPDFLHLDSLRFSQILNNLLSNALKATEKSKIKILARQLKGQTAKVAVIDHGIGLTEEEQSVVFSDYIQTSSYFNNEGTGLGLSICKSLAQLIGGEIGLKSEKGVGSNFWFTFNYEYTENKQIPLEFNVSENINLFLKVLLVDDMEINRSLARAMLEEYSCTVQEAESGLEAIEVYEDDTYDVVLMDINMPDINGDEVVRRIRKQYKANSVFIGLSANAMEGEREKFLDLGLDDYISKPITFPKLVNVLMKWFDYDERKTKVNGNEHLNNFLIDEEKISENASLMGGRKVFMKFIDQFIEHNQKIWSELTLNFKLKDTLRLKHNLHKLAGIGASIGASGYCNILHLAYKNVDSGIEITDEEFSVLLNSSKDIEKEMNEIKEKWQQNDF